MVDAHVGVSDADKALQSRISSLSSVVKFEAIVGCVFACVFGIFSLLNFWDSPFWGIACFVYALFFLLFGINGVNAKNPQCLLAYSFAGFVAVVFCVWVFITRTVDLVATLVDGNAPDSDNYWGASYGLYIFLLVMEMIATLVGAIFWATTISNSCRLGPMLRAASKMNKDHDGGAPPVVVQVCPPNIPRPVRDEAPTYVSEQPPPSYSDPLYRI